MSLERRADIFDMMTIQHAVVYPTVVNISPQLYNLCRRWQYLGIYCGMLGYVSARKQIGTSWRCVTCWETLHFIWLEKS